MANTLSNIIISAVDKTQAAFNSVNRNLNTMEKNAAAVNGIFSRLVPLLGAASVTAFAKNIIDSADNMKDLSERTGVSIERIAAWSLATQQSGTSIESLTTALDKGAKSLVTQQDELKKLGITAKSSEELIFQLADVISSLSPDDPRRVEIAMKFLGKSAAELIPLLSLGGDELRRMATEGGKAAEAMRELAPEADKFNDGLAELKQNSSILGARVFLPLIKYINGYQEEGAKAASVTELIWNRMKLVANTSTGIALLFSLFSDGAADVEKAAEATAKAAAETKKLENQLRLLNLQLAEQQASLAKNQRAQITEAYKLNIEAIKGQISGFKELQKAMVTAFDNAGQSATEALGKATAFLDSANKTRQSAQDRVTDLDLKDASASDADAVRNAQALDAIEKSKSARIQADYQRLLGNTAEAERQLDIAEGQAQRADDISGKLNDEGLARQAILDAAEALARVEESRAAIQKSIAQEETARQEALKQQMTENDARITDFTARLEQLNAAVKQIANAEANIKINADQEAIDKTLADIARVKAALASIPTSVSTKVQVTSNQVSDGNAEIAQFARGGLLRGRGTDTSDNLLAWLSPGEYIVKAAAVRKYGLGFVSALNSMNLPKFASGGAVSRASIPSLSSASLSSSGGPNTTINLTLPGMGAYRLQAAKDVANSLQRDLSIESLKYGSPK
jgi:hypothetical protein